MHSYHSFHPDGTSFLFDMPSAKMPPAATALIKGNSLYPDLIGVAAFYQTSLGILVNTQFRGLPVITENGTVHFLGFHIHENDLPPLVNCNGYAWQSFLTDSFTIPEILGHSVIVHTAPDDFMTQPSSNSGSKIACGIIQA